MNFRSKLQLEYVLEARSGDRLGEIRFERGEYQFHYFPPADKLKDIDRVALSTFVKNRLAPLNVALRLLK